MKTVVIDGVKYRPVEEPGRIYIVVLPNGFVYVGYTNRDDRQLDIQGKNLIRWGTTRHLGELIDGPLDNTVLGSMCCVTVLMPQDVHIIEVDQNAWIKHLSDAVPDTN